MSEDTREQQEEQFLQSCREMEALMARLPEMEKKNALWKRMCQAEQLLKAGEAYDRLVAERAFQEEQRKRCQEAGKKGLSAYIEAQMGYRQGPITEAKRTYDRLLKESGFESAQEAREWLSCRGENQEALKQEIETFQDAYSQALSKCQRLDEELCGEE